MICVYTIVSSTSPRTSATICFMLYSGGSLLPAIFLLIDPVYLRHSYTPPALHICLCVDWPIISTRPTRRRLFDLKNCEYETVDRRKSHIEQKNAEYRMYIRGSGGNSVTLWRIFQRLRLTQLGPSLWLLRVRHFEYQFDSWLVDCVGWASYTLNKVEIIVCSSPDTPGALPPRITCHSLGTGGADSDHAY